MLVLSRPELEKLLTPSDAIAAVEAAFALYAAGRCRVPARTTVDVGAGALLVMPAALDDPAQGRMLGTKLVSVYTGNRARGRPTVYASYMLTDSETGEPLALLEATYLTALRTGATSAVAARHLARAEAGRVACFGAGVQAAHQLTCLATVRRLERVAVIGRDRTRADIFANAMREKLGVPVSVAPNPREAVREANVIICATTSPSPVLSGADIIPGTHVDAVGAFRPTERELDSEAVRRARVVVDTYAAALLEAGDIMIPLNEGAIDRTHIAAELAEIVTGARPGRTRPDEITVFKSVGFAIEDLATARLAYNRAKARGAGTEMSL